MEKIRKLGLEPENLSYLQIDHEVLRKKLMEKLEKKGIILMELKEAKEKFNIKEEGNGIFLYIPENVKVDIPIQICFLVSKEQVVKNLIYLERGSSITIVSGCGCLSKRGIHIGTTKFIIKENAKLNYVMIHDWEREFIVKPLGMGEIEGTLNYIYINLTSCKLKENLIFKVKNGKVYLSSIISTEEKCKINKKLVFDGGEGEIITRIIAKNNARVLIKSELSGRNAKGYIDCKSIALSDNAKVKSVPILKSLGKCEFYHEASIGKISEDEILYLMSKGFSEEEAISLLIRGFAETGLENVPENIRRLLDRFLINFF